VSASSLAYALTWDEEVISSVRPATPETFRTIVAGTGS